MESLERGAIPPLDTTPTNALVKELVQTMTQLIKCHVELAKTEAMTQAKREIRAGAFMASAGLMALYGLMFLLAAGATALAIVLPTWLAVLIIAVIAFGIAGVMAGIGWSKRVKRPLWRTRETIEEDVRWLKPRTA
jgi:uncharacterized membrane protein YqjE